MPGKVTQAPSPKLKLVIRRLPPTLPEDVFWRVVAPWTDNGLSVWRRFVPGRPGDIYGNQPVHSRAYVLMASVEAVLAFHTSFDGHVFRSKSGVEFQAVVEFSPVQKTPFKAKSKIDTRQKTINDDPDYISFLESLQVPVHKAVLEVSTPKPQPISTPLLDHLRAQAAAGTKPGKGGKSTASGTSTDGGRRAAALASITDAASKRAPKTDKSATGGVIMVAGKGREVFVAPAEDVLPNETKKEKKDGKKKRVRNKDRDKEKDKDKEKDDKGSKEAKEGKPVKESKSTHANKKETRESKEKINKSNADQQRASDDIPPIGAAPGSSVDVEQHDVSTAGSETKGGGRGSRGRGRGGRGRGGNEHEGIRTPRVEGEGGIGPSSGGESGGRRGKDRSARGTVMSILSRNADSEPLKGSQGRSRSRGADGGGANRATTNSTDLRPSEARIDM